MIFILIQDSIKDIKKKSSESNRWRETIEWKGTGFFVSKNIKKSKNGFEIAKVAQPTNGLLRNFA